MAIFGYGSLAFLPLPWQTVLGWAVFGSMLLAKALLKRSPDTQRMLLIVLGLFLTLRYWSFRTFDTLFYLGFLDCIGMLLLYLAETYGILVHLLGMFVNAMPLKRKPFSADLSDPDLPTVDIYIPTYNEPEEMVAITATAAAQIQYPREKLNIFILDDGGTLAKRNDPDPEVARASRQRHEYLTNIAEFLSAEFGGVHYLTREKNVHAKAGNINNALVCNCSNKLGTMLAKPSCVAYGLEASCGDLILILDCDHVPAQDILKNTVGYFMRDEKLFLVQTPHFFINPDPVERNLGTFQEKPSENEMFYGAVQLGLDFWESSFFCGSAAVMRRSHLMENGGLAGETITEDAETALTLHSKGYNSVFVSEPMVCGLSPETFGDFIVQRNRWAQGMIQIFMLKNPLLIKGLKPHQRLCYLNNCIFWFFGLARMIFFLAPLMYLLLGLKVYNATLGQVAAYALPHLAGAILLSDHLYGGVRHLFFSELYETVQSVFNIPAIFGALFNPRSPTFRVTPKERSLEHDFLSPLAVPFYFLVFLCALAVPAAILRLWLFPGQTGIILITSFWAGFNLLLMFLCLGIVWERRQIRKKHRLPTDEPVQVTFGDGTTVEARSIDLSEEGIGLAFSNERQAAAGDALLVRARDSYGNEHRFRAEVVQARTRNGKQVLGCRFIMEDERTWVRIVRYVYGDSARWSRFWARRRSRRIGMWGGIAYLAGKAFEGLIRNFSGIMAIMVSHLLHGFGLFRRRSEKTRMAT